MKKLSLLVCMILSGVNAAAEPALSTITVTPTQPTINVTQTQQFTATGTFSDGSSRTLVGGGGLWVGKAPLLTPRSSHAAGVVNGILYAVGGYNGSSNLATVEAYDPVTNIWIPKTSMSTPRSSHAVGVANGILYAVGGYDGSSDLATVEAYDPATDSWIPKASMSTPRSHHTVGVANGILYAVGGINGVVNNSINYLASVEAYDPATNTWSPRAAMPISRAWHAMGVTNGILYATGGQTSYLDGSIGLKTVYAYDPVANTWMDKASMSGGARTNHAMGVVNGLLYTVGGYTSYDTAEAYDPATNIWTPRTALSTPRWTLAVGVVNGTLYAVGGYNGSTLSMVDAYTPPDGITWNSSDIGVATIDQVGLALGKSNGSTAISTTAGNISGSTLLMVVGGQPDLVVTAVTSSLTTVGRGKTFVFNSTTQNQGTAATTSTSTGLYLSTDAIITANDTHVGSVSIVGLASGASQMVSTSVTVPRTLARGTYYLGAIADYLGVQAESNESNNSFTGTTIQVK